MKLTPTLYKFSQSVILNYNDLKAGKDLTHLIEVAYGPKGSLFYI